MHQNLWGRMKKEVVLYTYELESAKISPAKYLPLGGIYCRANKNKNNASEFGFTPGSNC